MYPEPKDNLIRILQNEVTKLRQDNKQLAIDNSELLQIISLLVRQLDHTVVINSDELRSAEPPTFSLGENLSGELILRPRRVRC